MEPAWADIRKYDMNEQAPTDYFKNFRVDKAGKLTCKHCGGDKLYVRSLPDTYATLASCVQCRIEEEIHSG
jgi:hypothetical protein